MRYLWKYNKTEVYVCFQILSIKVKKLEQLVRLKDAKLQKLNDRLEALTVT